MGLMGDRYEGSFDGHKIQVVRTNVDKQVVVLVDEREIARESVALPHQWEQKKEFEVGGHKHTLAAHSVFKKLFGVVPIDNVYTVDIDGKAVELRKTQ
jgi:hypothetical protein